MRIRLADGMPISLEHVRLPAERFPRLLDLPLGGSLYDLLEEHYGTVPGEAEEHIEVVAASEDEASILGTEPGAPLLSITRTTKDEDGVLFEYSHDLFRADRTIITVRTPATPRSTSDGSCALRPPREALSFGSCSLRVPPTAHSQVHDCCAVAGVEERQPVGDGVAVAEPAAHVAAADRRAGGQRAGDRGEHLVVTGQAADDDDRPRRRAQRAQAARDVAADQLDLEPQPQGAPLPRRQRPRERQQARRARHDQPPDGVGSAPAGPGTRGVPSSASSTCGASTRYAGPRLTHSAAAAVTPVSAATATVSRSPAPAATTSVLGETVSIVPPPRSTTTEPAPAPGSTSPRPRRPGPPTRRRAPARRAARRGRPTGRRTAPPIGARPA